MTDQWNNGSGAADPASTNYASTDHSTRFGNGSSNDRWLRRPRRSTGDRKIAGVAGGLGRAFGVDPVLIRVAFVVLAIFGGFGGLLYVLGWLLLPSDGDEVSAAEALLGRGRSSVPPPLAVGLGVVAVVSAFSMFSWGRPFLPLAIGGVILLSILRKRGVLGSHGEWSGRDQRRQGRYRHSASGLRHGCGSAGRGRWGVSTDTPAGSSPFQRPAFWDQPSAGSGVRMTKSPSPATDPAENDSLLAEDSAPGDPVPGRTPPAWDPLGVAPFAWDLPEPTPLQPSAPVDRSGAGVVGRITLGATLLTGALTAAGVFVGWWTLTWAQVAGIALAVLALGLLISGVRGRGYALIGPGVFLSLVTMALAVTGISGITNYGKMAYHPANFSNVDPTYRANAGELTLDLSSITIPKGTEKAVNVELKGGHAEVIVPKGMNVAATCEVEVGRADCLGQAARGGHRQPTNSTITGTAESGTLNLNVKVNAGFAEVSTGATER